MKTTSSIHSILSVLISLTFATTSHAKDVRERCWGGEGPHPLIDMGGMINHKDDVPTVGNVNEYLLWEKQNIVIYRNQQGDIYRQNLISGVRKRVGHSNTELAKVADPKTRYIYTLGLNYVWDLFTGKWSPFAPKSTKKYEDVFYKNDALYFAEMDHYNGAQRFHFYDTDSGDGRRPICTWNITDGQNYKLGYGHQYPFVYLHTTKRFWGHNVLYVEKLDVSVCEIVTEYDYTPLPIEGDVIDVFRYEAMDAIAVTIDHPKKNLLWDDGNTCQFYEIPSSTVVPIRSDKPMFAVWAPEDGLSMMRIQGVSGAKRALVMNTGDLANIESRHFWLTQDGRKLFFSPHFASSYDRPLWEIEF